MLGNMALDKNRRDIGIEADCKKSIAPSSRELLPRTPGVSVMVSACRSTMP